MAYARTAPLIPTGSLIKTNSKFGHELVAGPVVGTRQVVGHKEPGVGAHVEWLDSAAQRYQFTEIMPPVNNTHGVVAWQRLEQRLGEPWAVADNCQHTAREAYFGVPDSPTWNAVAALSVIGGLLWVASWD